MNRDPKIVFLDIDGVLNSQAWSIENDREPFIARSHDHRESFDPKATALLDRLLIHTAADLVISSTWRKMITDHEEFADLLRSVGVTQANVIGMTPDHSRHPRGRRRHERGDEIFEWWITNRPGVSMSRFVVLDDDSDMTVVAHRFIQTDNAIGLTDDHVSRAVAMLSDFDYDEGTR